MYFSFRLPVGGHCPYRSFSGSWALPSQLLLGQQGCREGRVSTGDWRLGPCYLLRPSYGVLSSCKGAGTGNPLPPCAWKGNRRDRGNGLFHKEKARELAFMPMLCYLVTQTAGRTTYQSRRVSYDLLDLVGLFTSPPHINSPVR